MDPIDIRDTAGTPLAVQNMLAAFFTCRPYATLAQATLDAVNAWLSRHAADRLKWILVGENTLRFQKFGATALAKARAEIAASRKGARTSIAVLAGEHALVSPHRCLVKGIAVPRRNGADAETSLLQFSFPHDHVGTHGADAVQAWAEGVFSALGADSAYVSPALEFGDRNAPDAAIGLVAPMALQHPGLDVPSNESTCLRLGGNRCRGARWLTLLSPALAKPLGGAAGLRDAVGPGVDVHAFAGGVSLRAGAEPEIGSVNERQTTPLLDAMAHTLEPITLFGDNAILPVFRDDPEMRDRWERRFWR